MPPPSESVTVSVVIPVHNGEQYICAAIESVLAQTGSAAEVVQVIVVDNNSTDGTRTTVEKGIAEGYGERVMLIGELRPNAANARNAGVRLATGTWLAFLDADDLWLPGKLQAQLRARMEARREHPEAEMLFTLGEEFVSPDVAGGAQTGGAQRDEELSKLPCRPQPYPMLTPTSLLLRREVFAQVGDFPDVPSGEFIAWYGWAREMGYKDWVVPQVLVRRRIHARNSTRAGGAMAGYPMAAKWLLDRRRQAQSRAAS